MSPRANLAAAAASVQAASKGPGEQKSSIIPELAGQGTGGLPGWSHFMAPERETVDAWRGRQRIDTVDEMLNDSQVTALRQAVRLPVHRYVIQLDPMNAEPAAVDKLASDLDVPVAGGPGEMRPGRRADRFSARRHLDQTLDALDYGYAVFEHAGRYDDDGWWRLQGLPPVPQWTIPDTDAWKVDEHGRLLEVVQWGARQPVRLPVDHVTVFTWQGRAGDFRGRPMLRSLYRSYLMRDRTIRVMGMSAERTGMGIPVGKVSQGAAAGAKEKMSMLLGGMAAGHDTHLVLETDEDIRRAVMLMGVTGSTPDLVGMLRYHDESMARAMLAMLLQLGQTQTGSRALGGTFDDLLSDFHDTIVDWYCDGMQQQMVERWWTRNPVADQDAVPRLVWRRRSDEEDEGDDEQEAAPDPIEGTATEIDEPPALPAPTTASRARPLAARAVAGLARRQSATRSAFAATTGRELRRDPTEAELAAQTDFAAIEREHVSARDDLAGLLGAARDELAAVAVDVVKGMATVDPLTLGAALGPVLTEHAAEMDVSALVDVLVATCAQGVSQVIGEAARQGVELDVDIDYEDRADAEARELVRRMAVQVTESAAAAVRVGVPAQARRGLLGRLRPARLATVEADYVKGRLDELTVAQVEAAAAGAANRANNNGRFGAIATAPQQACYASELLDDGTCQSCEAVDGTEYESIVAAMDDYPGGGYVGCEGGERCRGTVVAIFEGEQETV